MPNSGVTEEDWKRLRAESVAAGLDAVRSEIGAASLPEVLLPYQANLLALTATHPVIVVPKSRRIGMTWGVAADAVLTAATARSAGGMDVMYIGYNLDMAREFIDVCAMWARAFIPAASAVEEFVFTDQGEDGSTKDIGAFRIRFASGFEVVALTSKPRSLRGRQGYLIFDEAAFHDQLGEMLKAAMAFLMWGGKVLVISTHDGVENPFNELIEEVRSGKRKGQIVRVDFDDAIRDGLYDRIALVKGMAADDEAKQEWIGSIFAFYGDDSEEELRCIPKSGTGVYLTRAAIEACMADHCHVARLTCPSGFELRPIPERVAYFERWIEDQVAPALLGLDQRRLTAIGGDFARSMDLSVFPVGQERANLDVTIPLVIELGNTPIAQQKQVLLYVISHCHRFGGACLDASGNGLGLSEAMQDAVGYDLIEAIKISSQWYLEAMPVLKSRIEDRTTDLPRDTLIRDDLRSIKLVGGVPRIPEKRSGGRHGDAAIGLAMLYRALGRDVLEIDFASAGARLASSALYAAGGTPEQRFPGDRSDEGSGAGWGSVSSGIDMNGF